MRIVTWNVNSLRVRLEALETWLQTYSPDVVGLQEIKMENAGFPIDRFQALGYHSVCHGQKTYNGVALLSKHPISNVFTHFYDDTQARFISANINGITICNIYVPNGSEVGSEKYHYKQIWLSEFNRYMKEIYHSEKKIVIMGDFNIAPADIDVYDPKAWSGQVLVSEPERALFESLLNIGFTDSLRYLNPEKIEYTWWDYRQAAFRRNLGLRIDHALVSASLKPFVESCWVEKEIRNTERPSDHAPLCLDLSSDFK